jgi:hypothetical protein
VTEVRQSRISWPPTLRRGDGLLEKRAPGTNVTGLPEAPLRNRSHAMKKFILGLALAAATAWAWALPSLADVEAQVQQGNYAQAESMMREVVAAKPNSARAHYVYGEILAHDGKFAAAAGEARLARQLDPDIKFTSPEKFAAFEASLQRQQAQATRPRVTPSVTESHAPNAPAAMAPAAAQASSGIPSWVWIGGLVVIGFLLWRGFSRSRAAAAGAASAGGAMAAPGAYGAAPMGPNAGQPGMPYGPGYPAARPGAGMLGLGAAAVGGVAAGMLADQLLHRRSEQNVVDPGNAGQPGFFDSPQGASELENRPIDFGTGGADWDSGSSDVGGGGDGGWD